MHILHAFTILIADIYLFIYLGFQGFNQVFLKTILKNSGLLMVVFFFFNDLLKFQDITGIFVRIVNGLTIVTLKPTYILEVSGLFNANS